ncbi:family 2B encapsulin nanocompartment shell protein [Saccharomonospora sp. NPDC006951]
MTVTEPDLGSGEQQPQSLGTAAARNLATTTKSEPQMQGISSRWLLKMLPWVQAAGGTYRVNRRLTCTVGNGRVSFTNEGARVKVVPPELREFAALRELPDTTVLDAMAEDFVQREYGPGEVIAEFGDSIDEIVLVAHGKVNKIGPGEYGEHVVLGTLADGDYVGDELLTDPESLWEYTTKTVTSCTALVLPASSFTALLERAPALRAHIDRLGSGQEAAANMHGEADVEVISGHSGEIRIAGTYVDYEPSPREYELSVAQTVLRVHTRVADLYNQPMNQLDQQLRLTIEALRERQEHELINNRDFGLLHNADLAQRTPTRTGPPTPDDFDQLLAMVWKEPGLFLAHPRTIAAFGRECSRRGIYPSSVDVGGHRIPAWRGVPIFPCNKIPVSDTRTSSVLLMRTGEDNQGVVGLHQTGIPDEYRPGLSVRFMGVNETAISSYLVSAYYSAAVLVPDALAVLEGAEVGKES